MDFYIALVVILTLLLGYPYLRFFIKRVILLIKLIVLCKRNNAKLHFTHLFPVISKQKRKNCDLYIETQYEILSLKLFGTPGRLYFLTFKPERKYFITRYLVIPSTRGGALTTPFNGKDKTVPKYTFDYKFKNQWSFKTFRKILLIHPVSLDNKFQAERSSRYLCNGDFLYDMEVFSYNGLKHIIEKSNSFKQMYKR